MIQHVVQIRNFSLLVANDWKFQIRARDLVDILDPSSMAVDGVGREADQLDAPLGEFGFQFRERAQLGGADGRVVLGVREEDDPLVSDELVEINGAVGRVGLKIRGGGAQAQTGGFESAHAHPAAGLFKNCGVTYGAGRSSVEDMF